MGLRGHLPFKPLPGRECCPGEEGEARAELKVKGISPAGVANVFGLPQKMVKGSLEPHLLYIHTSCLTLSKFVHTPPTAPFPQPENKSTAASEELKE